MSSFHPRFGGLCSQCEHVFYWRTFCGGHFTASSIVRAIGPRATLMIMDRGLFCGCLPVRRGWCWSRSEEHTSELQSRPHLVCRLLLEKKNTIQQRHNNWI